MKHFYLVLFFALSAFVYASHACEIEPYGQTSAAERKHLFKLLDQYVQEEYVYLDFNGQDWDVLKKKYQKRILSARDNAVFYQFMDRLVWGLDDEHSFFQAPWSVCEEESYVDDASPVGASTDNFSPAAKRLETHPSIGYLKIPSFNYEYVADDVSKALEKLLWGDPLTGLIIDMRGNFGGFLYEMELALGHFVKGKVGSNIDRNRSHPIVIYESELYPRLSELPLVLLINEDTVSAAEVFSSVLKAEKQALVVGETSAGNTESIYPYDFPDGSRLWLAIESFELKDGSSIEGLGIVPDVEVGFALELKLSPKDAYLEKALELFD